MNVDDFLQLILKISQQQNINEVQERNVGTEAETLQKAPNMNMECPERDVTEDGSRNSGGPSNIDTPALLNKSGT